LLFVAFFAAACNGSSTKPTPPPVDQFPTGPTLVCPTPVSVTSPNNQPTAVTYGTATATGGAPPVTVSCTPASETLFPVGSTTVTCTATDTRQRAGTCTFGVTVLPPPTITATRYVAFGDSLTRGEDGTAAALTLQRTGQIGPRVFFPPALTYPGVLQQLLTSRYTTQSFIVRNEGQSGERVADRATLTRFSRVVGSGSYDVVLLMEGANDLSDRDDRITASAIANLRQMIRDAQSRNVRPFLATIPPEVPGGLRALGWSLVAPFNDRLRELAASEGIVLVDVYAALNADTGKYVGFDGLHLTQDGYAKVADTFFTALKTALERPATTSLTPARAGVVRRR
jgi:lysophospholipase L1-like esterase